MKLLNRIMLLTLLAYTILFLPSCKHTTEPPIIPPPPPPLVEQPTLSLKLDDAHCTEAWLLLKTEKLTLPAELTLKQYNPAGDSTSQIINLTTKDTLLYIDSLLPGKTYSYQIYFIWKPKPDSQKVISSSRINVTTMDTTSHNFTFEMITFGGQIGSSVLYDVAIINENNIWAVGDIWIKDDTSSLGYTKYNAVHWDGSEWELKQLKYNNSVFSPIRGIIILNENNFYFAAGSVFYWDGVSSSVQMVYSRLSLPNPNGTIEKLWGSTNSNIYGVGYGGSLVHYNGTSWQRTESNTTLNINDIWGDYNEKTKEWEILAVGGNILAGFDNCVIQIQSDNTIKMLNTGTVNWPLRALWFDAGRNYYVAGSGIYKKHSLNDSIWKYKIFSITTYSINGIKGSAVNDIAATGGAGELIHYNGYSWQSFINQTRLPYGNYYSTDLKGNTIVAVGQNNPIAVIVIGKR